MQEGGMEKFAASSLPSFPSLPSLFFDFYSYHLSKVGFPTDFSFKATKVYTGILNFDSENFG